MIAMSDNVQVRKDTPSGTIVLNRPNRRNALSRETVQDIRTALEDFQQERTVRSIILTGSGDNFCSGSDLQQLKETQESPNAAMQWQTDTEEFQNLIEYMLRFPKPIIASVNGPALGSGLALLLACDVAVASQKACVKMPESRLGLVSGIAAPLLAFRIGTGRASYVMLTAQSIEAEQSLAMGLFHEVVPHDFIWARAQEIAKDIALGARHSHHLTKHMLNETLGESLFTYLSIGSAHTATARTNEDAVEGIKAFLEKRNPEWTD